MYYYENGQQEKEVYGERILRSWYEDGEKKYDASYEIDGKIYEVEWYPNGQMKSMNNYRDIEYEWYPDGTKLK